jgi:hypothetical protein
MGATQDESIMSISDLQIVNQFNEIGGELQDLRHRSIFDTELASHAPRHNRRST